MDTLTLQREPATPSKAPVKQKIRYHAVTTNEWVSLIVHLYAALCPNARNIACHGKYANPDNLREAYTGRVELNPLCVNKATAIAVDKQSRHWMANIQAIGGSAKTLARLLENSLVAQADERSVLMVLTDEPKVFQELESIRQTQWFIVSSRPQEGYLGYLKIRYQQREYLYFLPTHQKWGFDFNPSFPIKPHLAFNTDSYIAQIRANLEQSPLYELFEGFAACPQANLLPFQYIDESFRIQDHLKVSVGKDGAVSHSGLVSAMLQSMPELKMYNPVEMKETSLYTCLRNPLFVPALGYKEARTAYTNMGLDFPTDKQSEEAIQRRIAQLQHQTTPIIKPNGDQLLAYYKPGYYLAQMDGYLNIGGYKALAFVKGKKYYLYPVQRSEVLELPESEILGAQEKTTKKMSLHCTYTALSVTSELSASELSAYWAQQTPGCKVIVAEEYELTQKLSQALAMGLDDHAEELKKKIQSVRGKLLQVTSKDPNLSRLLKVFPPPDVKTLGEAYPDKVQTQVRKLLPFKAHLTDPQLLHAALISLKRGAVLTHNVGSGKTRIAAFAAKIAGAQRVLFVCKSKIIGEIVKELRDELKFPVVHLHSVGCLRQLREEVNAGQTVPETTFYVISQEFLTIGGLANQTFDPYPVDLRETIPGTPDVRIHTILCTRENAEKEIKAAVIRLRNENMVTGEVKRVPFHYYNHVAECPRCLEKLAQTHYYIRRAEWNKLSCATRKLIRETAADYMKRGKIHVGLREYGTFSKNGYCSACGYIARAYRHLTPETQELSEEAEALLACLGDEENTKNPVRKAEFNSALQFPAYKLIQGLFDTKICDEAHSLTGESNVHHAVKSITTQRTYLMSGTLLRRSPEEMWQVFTLLWGYGSPEFPYSYDQQQEFIDQHVTFRHIREYIENFQTKKLTRKNQKQEMPEPANAPKLWRFLHQGQLHATNRSMGLKLPLVNRHFVSIPLEDEILDEYDTTLLELRHNYVNKPAVFSTKQRADWFTQISKLQTIALKAKTSSIVPILKEQLGQNRSVIVACKLRETYEQVGELLREQMLPFVCLDEKRPSQPYKRREWLDTHFVKAPVSILLTRTALINESLNNLVKASTILVVEPEYVFYPLQQLEGRIARPRQQAESVDIIYLVTQHPKAVSVDEAQIQMALRRNNANVELVSGQTTQRNNAELIELAESAKMREVELLQTILQNTKAAEPANYAKEFAQKDAEMERNEQAKAQIIVDRHILNEIQGGDSQGPANLAGDLEAQLASLVPGQPVSVEYMAKPALPRLLRQYRNRHNKPFVCRKTSETTYEIWLENTEKGSGNATPSEPVEEDSLDLELPMQIPQLPLPPKNKLLKIQARMRNAYNEMRQHREESHQLAWTF